MMDVGLRESVSPLAAQSLPEERTAGLENADPPLQRNADAEFKLTKCVTIQARGQDSPNPSDKWMQYLHVSSGQPQYLSELPDNGHVLLHIDIPNQQVYPLPLLITPVHCVYLVTFNLPEGKEEEKKALKAIRDTLKDVYAYSSCLCAEPGLDAELCDMKTEVFLVGLQREDKNWSSFAGQLSDMLKTRSYKRLIVPPEGGDPYWTNLGAELSIHDNPALLKRIQRYSCRPPQLIHQSLACHCELLRRFKDDPFVPYEKVEDKGAGVSSISGSCNLEQFLNVLHCFGFIFYLSLPDLAPSERVVVLQPQELRQLFAQVQELSKERKWITTADLLRTAGMHIRDKQKWFQAMCTSMGLVIERSIKGKSDHVFVMGLEQESDLPERAHYSVDPLLVTYGPEDMEQMDDDYLLPSPLFPAFITAFLKKLKEQLKKTIAMKRHYLHVSVVGSTQIHVVEQDSFMEIGLQQFHVGNLTEGQQLKKLQQSCQGICGIISESAEDATASLKLDSDNLQYGFLCHPENTEPGDRFGKFDSDDGTLTCSCCNVPRDPAPQQQIWFSNVDQKKVVVQPVPIPMVGGGEGMIRKLEAGSVPAPAQLGQAPLGQAQLGQAPLGQAQLGQAQLKQAQLGQAQLGQAQLGQALFGQAQLGQAQLGQAQLGQAQLGQAQLGQAQLGQAQLGQAQLGPAQLGQALLGQAHLGQAQLRQALLGQAHLGQAHLGQAHVGQAQLGQALLGQAWLGQAWLGQAQLMLSQTVTDHPDHVVLFRIHVSRSASGKARAVLEGVGLDSSTISACFRANPQNDEETVQEGLTRWKHGQGSKPPSWGVLIDAMEYAGIAQQDVQGLKKKLGLLV